MKARLSAENLNDVILSHYGYSNVLPSAGTYLRWFEGNAKPEERVLAWLDLATNEELQELMEVQFKQGQTPARQFLEAKAASLPFVPPLRYAKDRRQEHRIWFWSDYMPKAGERLLSPPSPRMQEHVDEFCGPLEYILLKAKQCGGISAEKAVEYATVNIGRWVDMYNKWLERAEIAIAAGINPDGMEIGPLTKILRERGLMPEPPQPAA